MQLKIVAIRLAGAALQLLFPSQCVGCRREGSALCDVCVSRLLRLEEPYCVICSETGKTSASGRCRWCIDSPPPVDGIRVPFLMQGTMQKCIHDLKYNNHRALAPRLGQLLYQYLQANPIPGGALMPVPLHPRRLRSRGYNQSALLAGELSKLSGLPLIEDLLARTRNTPPQVRSAGRDQRMANVAGGFECRRDATGMKVILVDDVTTTGSTLFAGAAALKQAGAASVWGLALAKEA